MPHDMWRTIAAMFWRHENGAKWRSIPAELGPWWRAAQGVWERLLALVQKQPGEAFGMTFLMVQTLGLTTKRREPKNRGLFRRAGPS